MPGSPPPCCIKTARRKRIITFLHRIIARRIMLGVVEHNVYRSAAQFIHRVGCRHCTGNCRKGINIHQTCSKAKEKLQFRELQSTKEQIEQSNNRTIEQSNNRTIEHPLRGVLMEIFCVLLFLTSHGRNLNGCLPCTSKITATMLKNPGLGETMVESIWSSRTCEQRSALLFRRNTGTTADRLGRTSSVNCILPE
jgi:hypothetical protein